MPDNMNYYILYGNLLSVISKVKATAVKTYENYTVKTLPQIRILKSLDLKEKSESRLKKMKLSKGYIIHSRHFYNI